jgi:hypothetical protein
MPRDCDMRWFSTEEACKILSRFERVIVVGDSMMRHVVGALNVILRKDLGYGAVTQWNFNDEEMRECFCNRQFDVKQCSVQGIFSTSSVLEHDPESWACSSTDAGTKPTDKSDGGNVDLVIEMMLRYPLDPTEVERFQTLLSSTPPTRPYAFIFGHGLWNDLDLSATLNWLDDILDAAQQKAPYLASSFLSSSSSSSSSPETETAGWAAPPPRLFIPPSSSGILKPDEWLVSQGEKALQHFEHGACKAVRDRGVECLGTWNMSVQSSKYDGVHLDLKGNLVKAMRVLNWLSWL